jgi:hypothetical protein
MDGELTKELNSDEIRLLEIYREVAAMGFAELTIKIQDGRFMRAEILKQIKVVS